MSKPRIQFLYDTFLTTPEQGTTYFHCGKCLAELPPGQSPKEWARQQVSTTPTGLQVWCTRHNVNIATITARIAE